VSIRSWSLSLIATGFWAGNLAINRTGHRPPGDHAPPFVSFLYFLFSGSRG